MSPGLRAGILALVALYALAALSAPTAAQEGPTTFGPAEQGYPTGFTPPRVEVDAGSPVKFRNTGQFAHTVTFRDGSYDSGNLLPGDEATFDAPATPGEHAFVCRYHEENGMVGTLVVRAAAPTRAPATPATPSAPPAPSAPSPTPPTATAAPPPDTAAPPPPTDPQRTPAPGAFAVLLAAAAVAILARRAHR